MCVCVCVFVFVFFGVGACVYVCTRDTLSVDA